MEFIFEVIFGSILESVSDALLAFMNRRNKNGNKKRVMKVLKAVVGLLTITVLTGVFLGFLFLIEWVFPSLFDIVSF